MEIVKGNIWTFHNKGNIIVIPTNGIVKNNGENVMGRGLALQAKKYYSELPLKLGTEIKRRGNNVYLFAKYGLITFPVKRDWRDNADLNLISKSCIQLHNLVKSIGTCYDRYYMPKVGCGNGNLDWEDVAPILDRYLDERFIIVDFK